MAAAHGGNGGRVPGVSSWEWEQGDFTLSYRRMSAIPLDRARRGDSELPILIIFRALLINLIELECCDVRARRWGNWWGARRCHRALAPLIECPNTC